MLPRHGRAGSGRSLPPHELRGVHEASVARHLLPATVDYRGTGADSPVKDQAACGSCWVGCLSRSPCRTWGLGRLLVQGHGNWGRRSVQGPEIGIGGSWYVPALVPVTCSRLADGLCLLLEHQHSMDAPPPAPCSRFPKALPASLKSGSGAPLATMGKRANSPVRGQAALRCLLGRGSCSSSAAFPLRSIRLGTWKSLRLP